MQKINSIAERLSNPQNQMKKKKKTTRNDSQDKNELTKIFVLRRILNPMGTTDAVEFLLGKMKQTKSNSEFFDSMNT